MMYFFVKINKSNYVVSVKKKVVVRSQKKHANIEVSLCFHTM